MNVNELALIENIAHYNENWHRNLPLERAGRKEHSHFKSSQISINVLHAVATLWRV